MIFDKATNKTGETLVRYFNDKTSMLDGNNIVWMIVSGLWIGKRSVWIKDNRACWLEDTAIANVKEWWCGKDADYKEIFYRD